MDRTIMFRPGHLDFFSARTMYDSEINEKSIDQMNDPNNFVYSVLSGHKVIAIVGLRKMWDGVAELWSMTSDDIKEHPIYFHKSCINLIDAHIKTLGLHRLQCSVRSDYNTGMKWIESLGFHRDGIMSKYGPNKLDYILYTRTTE